MPQQAGRPLVLIAHACEPEAAIAVTVPTPAGIAVWPSELEPQQTGTPLVS